MRAGEKVGVVLLVLLAGFCAAAIAAGAYFSPADDRPSGHATGESQALSGSAGMPAAFGGATAQLAAATVFSQGTSERELDVKLMFVLRQHGFTGNLESQLRKRLGRNVDRDLAEIGQNLFFDKILALGNDNSCGSCHAPQNGFADSQSIAIGIGSNDIVG